MSFRNITRVLRNLEKPTSLKLALVCVIFSLLKVRAAGGHTPPAVVTVGW